MAVIAVTSVGRQNAKPYIESIEKAGGQARLLLPQGSAAPLRAAEDSLLDGVGGLLLTGGPDIAPGCYGEPEGPQTKADLCPQLDALELGVLNEALQRDLPVLAICRGMQLLNVALGGKLLQHVPGHRSESKDGRSTPSYHHIFLSPGTRLAAVLGSGGFVRVNSLHHQGLREAQRSPRLLSSAYSLEDGIVEGLESPDFSWVIGVQWHPERVEEVPKSFFKLFTSFVERAENA